MLYQGWDMEGMREAGDVAPYAHTPSSPGFTAINQCSPQPSSPVQALAVSQMLSKPVQVQSAAVSSRRRNPTVASYLGLGDSDGPAHLVKYAPTPDGQPPPPQPTWKRQSPRTSEKASSRKKPRTDHRTASSQRPVSETLHVTKPSTRSATRQLDRSTDEHLPTPVATASAPESQQQQDQEKASNTVTTEDNTAPPVETSRSHATATALGDNDDDNYGQLCFKFEINTRNFDTPTNSKDTSEPTEHLQAQFSDEDFDDDLMDDDLLDLTTETIDNSSPQVQSSSPVKFPAVNEPFSYAQLPETSASTSAAPKEDSRSSIPSPKKFVSPVTLTTRLVAAAGDEARKPIVRPPFPTAVRDRSPIIGLSSNTLLRSCFRVGEAISQSCHAAKAGNNVLIELYARVLSSERDDLQQRFTFCDLFHAKPPYIQATYAAAIWKTVQLFEFDSARLMQQGRICRCIGTMKRNGKDWVMTVLNIWEATWDDVQWVEGIVKS